MIASANRRSAEDEDINEEKEGHHGYDRSEGVCEGLGPQLAAEGTTRESARRSGSAQNQR